MAVDNRGKWVFIVNPIAGNGFAKTIVPEIETMMEMHNAPGEIVFTEKPGHASDLSREYFEKGFRYIIGVGGDGTLNEISGSLVGKEEVIIGIIPAGTGNDFIQILGFPNRFREKEWVWDLMHR